MTYSEPSKHVSSGSDERSEALKPGVRWGVTGAGWPEGAQARGCLSWDLNDEKQPLCELHWQGLQPLGRPWLLL